MGLPSAITPGVNVDMNYIDFVYDAVPGRGDCEVDVYRRLRRVYHLRPRGRLKTVKLM
jgi:hypothetical protein